MNNKNLATRESIVAFVDMLGASKLINQRENESLNDAHYVCRYITDYLKPFADEVNLLKVKPDFRIFSDNIVISAPVEQGNLALSFLSVILHVGIIQNYFLMIDIPTRGGIAIDGFYSDHIMLWGKALVTAYELENSAAIYPRVVIQPLLIERLDNDSSNFKHLKKDVDGLYYVDYLKMLSRDQLPHFVSVCDKIISESQSNIRVIQKIEWLKNYIKITEKLYHGGEKYR